MKKLIILIVAIAFTGNTYAAQQTILGGAGVEWGDEKVKINSNFTELYTQAFDANITYDDVIATITANWVNTANPWADDEVADNITIDLADTATALAANGANCSPGNYPLGVDASGAVEGCTAAGAGSGDLLANGTIPMTADWSFGAFDITGGVDSTWSGQGSYGNLTAGAGGFTVDADGDVVAKSVTQPQTATAQYMELKEASGNGTNKFTITASSITTDNAWLTPTAPAGGDNYLLEVDADGTMAYKDPAGFETADSAIVKSDESETITSPWYFSGLTTAKINVESFATGTSASAQQVSGSYIIATAAMVLTLPTAAEGYSFCFLAGQGVTAIIQVTPATGDYLVVDGVRGTAATAYASEGDAGDKICAFAADANDWYVTSEVGTWEE